MESQARMLPCRRRCTIGGALLVSLVLGAAPALGAPVVVSVPATAGPWQFGTGLNGAFEYGYDDDVGPTVVTASNGLDLSAGDSVTITYLSGGVSIGAGRALTDGVGLTSLGPINGNPYVNPGYNPNPPPDPNYEYAPSLFVNPTQYPAYLGELAATFADGSGQIVGTPFIVGDQDGVTVPPGATQLQLGVNDVAFADNSGAWQVQVSVVPEAGPGLAMGLVGVPLLGRRRRRA